MCLSRICHTTLYFRMSESCVDVNVNVLFIQVRVATMVDNPRFRGKQPAWRHVQCFLETGWWSSPMGAMAGWDNLSVKDQGEVAALAKTSPGTSRPLFAQDAPYLIWIICKFDYVTKYLI
jgi:hypothetical protein